MKKWLEHRPYKHRITYWLVAIWFFFLAVLFLVLGITAGRDLACYLILCVLWVAAALRELYYCKKRLLLRPLRGLAGVLFSQLSQPSMDSI